jgi:transcriptional regulator with XRE-family HTH domain
MRRRRPIDPNFGLRIRAARKARLMTLADVGRAVGVSLSQVSCWECGKDRMSCEELAAIAAALECEPAEFFARPIQAQGANPFEYTKEKGPKLGLRVFE